MARLQQYEPYGSLSNARITDKAQDRSALELKALEMETSFMGSGHQFPDTLISVANPARKHGDQEHWKETEEPGAQLIKSFEAFVQGHTSMPRTIGNLDLTDSNQDRMADAERMYQRAPEGKETHNIWGPEHTSTLDTANNLGNLYTVQGKLVEAEQMYQGALQGYEKVLGTDHTSTLDTVNNLGNLYKSRGKLDEAEKMYQRALQGYEKALGPEHSLTLSTANKLEMLYKNQDKLEEAEWIYQRALEYYEKVITSSIDNITT
ncbi:hypothetical protein BJ875DRAFT_408306 [Amylocarpus encephaloides]|uniref:TPR-like protein n=1 Tax=Amylocarpus encephaloides TaxID=45428 RepID=A0A9P8C2A7_9HELO|nr:hypothetical protein BJ875DRAFT_408306 [Amylocarpus encephaloides]